MLESVRACWRAALLRRNAMTKNRLEENQKGCVWNWLEMRETRGIIRFRSFSVASDWVHMSRASYDFDYSTGGNVALT